MEVIKNQVRNIILQRSLSYRELLPSEGDTPIFPDRQSYIVEIQLINNVIWVELLRDQFPIDSFEIIIHGETVTYIEHPIVSDSIPTPTSNYPRERIVEFQIYQWEFLLWIKQYARKEKLNKLFSQEL